MKRGVLWLVIALPLASVLMGVLTFYLAFTDADPVIEQGETKLSKTSWQPRPPPTDSTPPEVRIP